mgnify:CR=1 FL=1
MLPSQSNNPFDAGVLYVNSSQIGTQSRKRLKGADPHPGVTRMQQVLASGADRPVWRNQQTEWRALISGIRTGVPQSFDTKDKLYQAHALYGHNNMVVTKPWQLINPWWTQGSNAYGASNQAVLSLLNDNREVPFANDSLMHLSTMALTEAQGKFNDPLSYQYALRFAPEHLTNLMSQEGYGAEEFQNKALGVKGKDGTYEGRAGSQKKGELPILPEKKSEKKDPFSGDLLDFNTTYNYGNNSHNQFTQNTAQVQAMNDASRHGTPRVTPPDSEDEYDGDDDDDDDESGFGGDGIADMNQDSDNVDEEELNEAVEQIQDSITNATGGNNPTEQTGHIPAVAMVTGQSATPLASNAKMARDFIGSTWKRLTGGTPSNTALITEFNQAKAAGEEYRAPGGSETVRNLQNVFNAAEVSTANQIGSGTRGGRKYKSFNPSPASQQAIQEATQRQKDAKEGRALVAESRRNAAAHSESIMSHGGKRKK